MSFSVCIPTFNRLEDLKACYYSICASIAYIGEPVEVLISDNQSTDGTAQWLQNLAVTDARVRLRFWTNPENIGPVGNINLLASRATGDHIFYITDDDLAHPNALAVSKQYIEKYNFSFMKLAATTYLVNTKKTFYSGAAEDIFDFGDPENFVKIAHYTHMLSGCVVRNTSGLAAALDRTRCAYPSIKMCALNAGSCAFIAEPAIFHVWENPVYWDLDVDMSSDDARQRQLNRDQQLAYLETPEGFLTGKAIARLYEMWVRTMRTIEPEVIERFGPLPPALAGRIRAREGFKSFRRRLRRQLRQLFIRRKG